MRAVLLSGLLGFVGTAGAHRVHMEEVLQMVEESGRGFADGGSVAERQVPDPKCYELAFTFYSGQPLQYNTGAAEQAAQDLCEKHNNVLDFVKKHSGCITQAYKFYTGHPLDYRLADAQKAAHDLCEKHNDDVNLVKKHSGCITQAYKFYTGMPLHYKLAAAEQAAHDLCGKRNDDVNLVKKHSGCITQAYKFYTGKPLHYKLAAAEQAAHDLCGNRNDDVSLVKKYSGCITQAYKVYTGQPLGYTLLIAEQAAFDLCKRVADSVSGIDAYATCIKTKYAFFQASPPKGLGLKSGEAETRAVAECNDEARPGTSNGESSGTSKPKPPASKPKPHGFDEETWHEMSERCQEVLTGCNKHEYSKETSNGQTVESCVCYDKAVNDESSEPRAAPKAMVMAMLLVSMGLWQMHWAKR